VVFRRDLMLSKLGNVPPPTPKARADDGAELRAAIGRQYPDWEINRVAFSRRKLTPAEATLVRDGDELASASITIRARTWATRPSPFRSWSGSSTCTTTC
jgi:hypothetical protein